MKKISLILLAGAFLSLNSHAQSWSDYLKSTAAEAAKSAVGSNLRQAIHGAVDKAAQGAMAPAQQQAAAPAGTADAGAPAAAPVETGAAVAAAPAVPAGCPRGRKRDVPLAIGERPESFQPASLWPEASCPVYHFSDLKFEKARAAKTAFREASKIRCTGCEGGYAFDAWGGQEFVKNGVRTKQTPNILIELQQGEYIGWKGNKYNVTITATGSHPIGDFPCKQYHYVLKDGKNIVAEYDGMYCEYQRPYISKPDWNEVV
jgi:hypothetical protein